MRAAAKVPGIGVASARLRGVPMAPPAEQSVRQGSQPLSAALSSEGVKAAEAAPLHTAASWDLDDWELESDELVMEAGEPMPRVVFAGVPSFQEAKAATSELKDAIDEVYLSLNSSEREGSASGSEVSVSSPLLAGKETKSCVVQAISTPSVPKHALQAFKLLSTNSEAQTVVASVASDPNVWDAFMQNPSLKDFLQSHQAAAGFEGEESTEKLEDTHNSDQNGNGGNGFDDFMDLLQNIKCTVSEMVSSVSNYLKNIFELPVAAKTSSDATGNTKANFMDPTAMGGSLMGLALLVVMVVLLKRV